MKKLKALIFSVFSLAFLLGAPNAEAFLPIPVMNLEPLQNILGVAGKIVSGATTDIEKARDAYQKVSSEASGAMGTIKKNFNTFKSASGAIGTLNMKVPDYLAGILKGKPIVSQPDQSKEVLAKRVAQYGPDSEATYEKAEAESQALLYEDLADLFAVSLSTHYNLLQEAPASEAAQGNLDNRDLVQATMEKAAEANTSLSRILLMEAGISTYRLRLRSSALKATSPDSANSPGGTNENKV